ncbi:hypothetical protein LTR04_002239 [Oleoguttula sp. CCFEE 6159]|nr:hypothetical protein LTR04_002239 [Oleoguttula sp. CCFEE 6159]
MKRLDGHNKELAASNTGSSQNKIGRIHASQLEELDNLHRDESITIERRGRAWSGAHLQLTPRSTGNTQFEPTMDHSPESEHSSITSTSERTVASDTDDSDDAGAPEEPQKYRLSDVERLGLKPPTETRMEAAQNHKHDAPTECSRKDSPMAPLYSATNRTGPEESPGDESTDGDSYFSNYNTSRANSIYSLSRSSFTNQISQLTSIQLPQTSSLSSSISAIPTSTAAARALTDAAAQIRRWIQKASEVLNDLDAEDDVEWAAAGGREGVGEVDQAIKRFENLVEIYVIAIEQMQMRKDIGGVQTQELQAVVTQMEGILKDWQKTKATLRGVKEQVEIAMEWGELWNTVIGEIGLEIGALDRLVFEMEERRHRSALADGSGESASLDIGELETIVEETPPRGGRTTANNRFSLPPAFAQTSPIQAPAITSEKEDSNLLALFARMQPLRASLDFLPMRLSVFHCRGNLVFPTACIDLEKRRDVLEEKWKKLEADAEALRRELGEDRWVLVFRNAGRQALKMCESVARSYSKLRQAIDNGAQHTDLPATAKKIESYEAKKMHYGPAIERVLAIIDRGVLDRLTVNGEILRLQSDMKRRWSALQADMRDMDLILEELNTNNRNQQLRDSISTILSTDRSVASSTVETPGSSPASSVVLSGRKHSDQELSTPAPNETVRLGSLGRSSKPSLNDNRRHSSMPIASSTPHKSLLTRSSASEAVLSRAASPSPRSSSRMRSSTPQLNRPSPPVSEKPRWNSSTKVDGTSLNHTLNPITPMSASPSLRKHNPTSRSLSSQTTIPSPLSRSSAFPPTLFASGPANRHVSAPLSTPSAQRAAQAAMGRNSPAPAAINMPRLRTQASMSLLHSSSSRRRSILQEPMVPDSEEADDGTTSSPSVRRQSRPSTPLGKGARRESVQLPPPIKAGAGSRGVSRASGQHAGDDGKPRWH